MEIEKCNDEFQQSWLWLLFRIARICTYHKYMEFYQFIYQFIVIPITILSLKENFSPNHPTRNFTTNSLLGALLQRVSSYEARHSVLLHEALRITFATNPLQLALRNGCTRVPTLCHPHTHTHTQTRARCTWRLYVGARLEVTVRSATREASLFSNALVNWPIAGSSPPTPSYSLLSLSLWSPLPSVNRGRNNLMIGSRFASIQRLLRRRASRRRFSTYLRPSSTFFLDINLFVIRTVLCISHRTLDRCWFHGKFDDRSNVLRK